MYKIKEETANLIRTRYKAKYVAETIGVSAILLSLVMRNKKPASKKIAYAITKFLNPEAEIEDYFERIV